MRNYMKIYQERLSNSCFDEAAKEELRAVEDDENEVKERFYMDLEFGTAGLRGVVSAGTNRTDIHVAKRAAQGLANYITKQGGVNKGVAIAYDSRHMLPEFATETTITLAVNGIKACKFESLCPTPELPFVAWELGCIAGINVTASHNPPECNGYEVCWEDGAQFIPSHDKGVTDEVLVIKGLFTAKTMDRASAVVAGKYQVIGKEIDDKYIVQVKAQVVSRGTISEMQGQIIIVYTPLHGTGNIPAKRVVEGIGLTHTYVVPKQELPDSDFPTVSYPNPEAEEIFVLDLKLAREKDVDLVLAIDPNVDRLGIYVKDVRSGNHTPPTDNIPDSLLHEYVFSQKQAAGKIPADGQMTRSIASTNLIDAAAKECGCRFIEVLTGFKQIGQRVPKNRKTGQGTYLSGMRESCGCLIGTYARDRDAVSVTAALCEAAAYYRQKGMTLRDAMVTVYDKYGYYKDAIKSTGLSGIGGLAKIQSITETLRVNMSEVVGSYKVISTKDYKLDTVEDMTAGEARPTEPPSSDVLYYGLNDGAWTCVRSSGTRPKIRFYYGIKGSSVGDTETEVETLGATVMAMVDRIM